MCYGSTISCVRLLICRVRAAVTSCHNNCMGTLFFSIRGHFVHSLNVTCECYTVVPLRTEQYLASLWQYYGMLYAGQFRTHCSVMFLL